MTSISADKGVLLETGAGQDSPAGAYLRLNSGIWRRTPTDADRPRPDIGERRVCGDLTGRQPGADLSRRRANFFHGLSISGLHLRRQGMTTKKDRS
jgi:hypothetical protein